MILDPDRIAAMAWSQRLAAKREQVRRDAWAVIAAANDGQQVDPLRLQWARDFVRMNPSMVAQRSDL